MFGILFNVFAGSGLAIAADVDVSRLPPPAPGQVEFVRDIKPIFEHNCLKCHGTERPKSHFSLVTRESALKGGDNGVDILPGDSAKSPLIHYVAHLVEDMAMPPPDKGEPLTPEQIGLLRAWIDQGAQWEAGAPASLFSFNLALRAGGGTVHGNEKKFRELQWQREGPNGGVEDFSLSDKVGKDAKLTVEGRALLDDYRVALTVEKNDVGFTRFGWEQFRKYYDDSGGYFPGFTPSVFSLDRDLHMDLGRAWADFGLTLPGWPRMVLGYEYQYREGDESTLQWGKVNNQRNTYPAAKAIDERVHILKFDLDYEFSGGRIEDRFRGEFYDLRTRQLNARSFTTGSSGPSQLDDVRESYRYFSGANTLRVEKSFKDWLFASAGHLYSKLNAYATFSLNTQFPLGAPAFYAIDRWRSQQQIVLERETHAANLSALLGPWDGLTLSAGVLSDWTRQSGFGMANLDLVTPFSTSARLATLDGNSCTTTVEENVALRYTKIPFTALFAEARLKQESRGLSEGIDGGFHDFMQRTDASSDVRDLRAGFSTSPWRLASFSAHYRRYEKETDYDHRLDQADHDAYPAFIRARDADTDEVETKLTLRPRAWLKTTFTYKYETTDYETATDPVSAAVPGDNLISEGGGLESAHYDAHTFSLNATFTPWKRLYLSGTFSYQNTRMAAFDNDSPSIVPYRGDRFSALASATWLLNNATDLHGSYSFSTADYGQNNFADGLPLGIHYQEHALMAGLGRRFNKNVSAKLQYRLYYYDEPGSGGANDFTAHAVFGTLVFRLP